jgi:hypothetical protein
MFFFYFVNFYSHIFHLKFYKKSTRKFSRKVSYERMSLALQILIICVNVVL